MAKTVLQQRPIDLQIRSHDSIPSYCYTASQVLRNKGRYFLIESVAKRENDHSSEERGRVRMGEDQHNNHFLILLILQPFFLPLFDPPCSAIHVSIRFSMVHPKITTKTREGKKKITWRGTKQRHMMFRRSGESSGLWTLILVIHAIIKKFPLSTCL